MESLQHILTLQSIINYPSPAEEYMNPIDRGRLQLVLCFHNMYVPSALMLQKILRLSSRMIFKNKYLIRWHTFMLLDFIMFITKVHFTTLYESYHFIWYNIDKTVVVDK